MSVAAEVAAGWQSILGYKTRFRFGLQQQFQARHGLSKAWFLYLENGMNESTASQAVRGAGGSPTAGQ